MIWSRKNLDVRLVLTKSSTKIHRLPLLNCIVYFNSQCPFLSAPIHCIIPRSCNQLSSRCMVFLFSPNFSAKYFVFTATFTATFSLFSEGPALIIFKISFCLSDNSASLFTATFVFSVTLSDTSSFVVCSSVNSAFRVAFRIKASVRNEGMAAPWLSSSLQILLSTKIEEISDMGEFPWGKT